MERATSRVVLAVIAIVLAAVPTAHAAGAGNVGVDAGHSGYSATGPAPPLIAGWSRLDLRGATAPPVADAGSVFADVVRGDSALLTALDASTGATRWEEMSAAGPIAAAGGRAFGSTQPQFAVGARNAATGAIQWRDDETLFNGPVADGGVVAVAGVLGVRVLDAATGAARWEARDGAGPIALDTNRVYVLAGGKTDCVVRAYPRNALLGLTLQAWSTPCGASAFGSDPFVVAAGRVYAQELVLDAASGRKLYDLPAHVGLAVAPDGSAFVARDGVISAQRPDGSQRWGTAIAGNAATSMVLTGATLYAVFADGALRALDTTSGAITWSATTPLSGVIGLTVTDDALVLAGQQGIVTFTAAMIRSVRALAVRLRSGRSGSAAVRIALERPATIRMVVYRGRRVIARRTARAPAGRRTISAPLSRATVRGLRRASGRSLRIVITASDGGATQRIAKSAALRR
jgi:outer membrane protein assembly factor BamB